MRWLRTLYARQLNPDRPGGFWGNAKACLTIAFFLSLHVWTFLLIYQRFIFYDFFVLGRGLRFYLPVLALVIAYALIDRNGIRSVLADIGEAPSRRRKQINRRVWTYYLASVAILILAIKLGPHIRPPHDKVLAAYYRDNEYWRYQAVYEMGNSKDTFYIKHLMYEVDDYRMSTYLHAKGNSMATAKTSALAKITGETNDTTTTWGSVDTGVVNYWKLKYPQYYVSITKRLPQLKRW